MLQATLRQILSRRVIVASGAALAIVAAAGVGAQAQTKIDVGTVYLSSTDWTHFVAEEMGWYKEQGIEVSLVATRASSKTVQQLAAGSLHLASSGIPDHLRAIYRGAPVRIFKNQIGTPPYTIYGKPGIKSIKDLKGKKMIVGGPRDVTRHYTETLFKKHGLMPGQYDYLFAGSTGNRFAALVSGGVDAAIVLPPISFRAAKEGFTNLGNVQTVLADFPFTVHAYNIGWAKDNRKALVGYTAALLKATDWLYDTKNRERAADILVKGTRSKKPDALATYDLFIKGLKAISRDSKVTKSAYDQTMKVLVGWGDVKGAIPPMSKYYDPSILAEARKKLK